MVNDRTPKERKNVKRKLKNGQKDIIGTQKCRDLFLFLQDLQENGPGTTC